MEDVLFCVKCGAKTLVPTGKDDYEAGDEYWCSACGAEVWISSIAEKEVVVREAPKWKFEPIKRISEQMLERAAERLYNSRFVNSLIYYAPLLPNTGKVIKFRRYADISAKTEPASEEADKTGETK